KVLKYLLSIRQYPPNLFYQTKNPKRYLDWLEYLPQPFTTLSTTIETNRDWEYKGYSKAPTPTERFLAMLSVREKQPNRLLHVSIEPIMDFDLPNLASWMAKLKPWKVSVGYDNYRARLPEPSLAKTKRLIHVLRRSGISVEVKNLREPWDG
ncbi:MAG: hypothetical protein ACXQTF_04325, partial [Candidatus Hecatellaceae archaeon]